MSEENENKELTGESPGVLRSIREIVKDLSKPIAQKHQRKRQQGGKQITYLAWHDAVKYLDYFAAGWCYEIRSIESIAGKVILIVRITIPCAEGVVYREATGQENEELDREAGSKNALREARLWNRITAGHLPDEIKYQIIMRLNLSFSG